MTRILTAGVACQQVAESGCGLDQLFEIVEDEQSGAVSQYRCEASVDRSIDTQFG